MSFGTHLRTIGLVAALCGMGACCGDTVRQVNFQVRALYGAVGDTTSAHAVALGGGIIPCTLYDSDDRPSAFSWSSSAPNVATIGQTGIVVLRGPGEAAISVSADGVSASYSATVLSSPPFNILQAELEPRQISVGDTARVTVRTLDVGGNEVNGVYVALTMDRLRDSVAVFLERIPKLRTPVQLRLVGAKPGAIVLRANELRWTFPESEREVSVAGVVLPP